MQLTAELLHTERSQRRRSRGGHGVLDARVVSGLGGGPDKTILNSPRYLERAGYRMICAYLHPPGDPGFEMIRTKARLCRAPLISVPDRGPFDWRVVPILVDICRHERVQIWHGHDYKSNLLGLVVSKFRPMRLVTTAHGWVQHTFRTPLYYGIDRFCLRYYEKVFCVSPDLHMRCRRAGVPADRCELLENGIDLDEYSRLQNIVEAKRALGFDPRRYLVGAVGRLSAEKGYDVLIRAAARLLRSGLNLELVIVGEGGAKKALQNLAAELACSANVHFVGYQSDTCRWYEAMDVFALSSLREGLPNVLLEAMALEVPVVATRIAGIPRLIDSEHNGLLIEPNAVTELADALTRLLGSPELRARFQAAGRLTVERRFSFATRMDKLAQFYDRLCTL
jgi:glycosyltransferase involved in cell wall biosynthesis